MIFILNTHFFKLTKLKFDFTNVEILFIMLINYVKLIIMLIIIKSILMKI